MSEEPAKESPNVLKTTMLWKVNVVSSLLLGLLVLMSIWLVIPHRVTNLERRLDRIEKTQIQWVELLIRIDERVERMSVEQERLRESDRQQE